MLRDLWWLWLTLAGVFLLTTVLIAWTLGDYVTRHNLEKGGE